MIGPELLVVGEPLDWDLNDALHSSGYEIELAPSAEALQAFCRSGAICRLALVMVAPLPSCPVSTVMSALLDAGRAANVLAISPPSDNERIMAAIQTLLTTATPAPRPKETATQPVARHAPTIVLNHRLRCIQGPPTIRLSSGECTLLTFLGANVEYWHSSGDIARSAYGRTDTAGRQLVWKYASTLKRKLSSNGLDVIEGCRQLGYRCLRPVLLINSQSDPSD